MDALESNATRSATGTLHGRAFVKEAEDTVPDLPDRPVSRHRNFVTLEGLAAIKSALAVLKPPTKLRSLRAIFALPLPPCAKYATGGRGARARKSSSRRLTQKRCHSA